MGDLAQLGAPLLPWHPSRDPVGQQSLGAPFRDLAQLVAPLLPWLPSRDPVRAAIARGANGRPCAAGRTALARAPEPRSRRAAIARGAIRDLAQLVAHRSCPGSRAAIPQGSNRSGRQWATLRSWALTALAVKAPQANPPGEPKKGRSFSHMNPFVSTTVPSLHEALLCGCPEGSSPWGPP
ncbi:hypothetical protein BK121_08475 [Paenibacillus odorifer]|nr:hypothetical protein BK121_08475 [Paenibacillus odorifer]